MSQTAQDKPRRERELSAERRKLLERLLEQEGLADTSAKIQPRPVGTQVLSFAQHRLWFLDQLFPASSSYIIPLTFCLAGVLNIDALQTSLTEIVRRHESLRTIFPGSNGQPLAQVVEPSPFALPLHDLRAMPDAERADTVKRMTRMELERPFELTRGPLFRATLLRVQDDEHVFVGAMHHIVSDGWSQNVFTRELSTLYADVVSGRPSSLPELEIQYADFAHWQREWLQGDTLESQLAYWRQQLANAPVQELPSDIGRAPDDKHQGEVASFDLSASLTMAVRTLSNQENATPFMTLLTAFKVLLARLTQQEDLVIGTPVAGRTRTETESLIGLFLNTLVLRTNLSGNPTFVEALARVREVALGAYAHQDLPFEKLVEVLQPERHLSRNPFFDILFNYVNTPPSVIELPGIKVHPLEPDGLDAKFALTLYANEHAGQIQLLAVYQQGVFSSERVQELLRQLGCLLEQVIVNPRAPISSYSLVSSSSRPRLPDPTEILAEPVYPSVPAMVLEWAERNPGLPAVAQSNRTWTYGELATTARRLANSFHTAGLEPRQVIAITGPRSYDFIASMLAVLMSGHVMLTLNRKLPVARQKLILHEANCRHVVYVGKLNPDDAWMQSANLVLHFVDSAQPFGNENAYGHFPTLMPRDPAYIFFTSGTTGVPKGVLGCHGGLSHFIAWEREQFQVTPADRSAQLTGLAFDVVLRDVFLPLSSGATLVLPDDPDDLSADKILPWMEHEQITLLHTVPSLAQAWLLERPANVTLASLRQVFFAGEPLTESLISQWRAAFPNSGKLANFYGPTETTLAKLFFNVPEQPLPGVQPVGSPLPCTQALVLNAKNQLCGIGEIGEIVIRTPFRTLGYLNAESEPAQRFFANPFRADENDLLYRTGDRGRYRVDGMVDILGRLDHQVKIRGVRVEPDEVNALLGRHPAIAESVVLAQDDDAGEKHLVAYAIPHASKPSVNELREFLRTQLPDYMIPAAFVLLDRFPLTPNGKIDRRALPAPDKSSASAADTFAAPRTPIEETLVAIWAEVLRNNRIGVQDNFFELGGHSLLATQIVSRVRHIFKIELPLRVLFEHPTVAGLSDQIETYLQAEHPHLIALEPVKRDQPVPLSYSQERMWFIHQLNPDSSAYNMSSAIRWQGRLNVDALRQSFNEIVRRHETLRTTFMVQDGQPIQVISPAINLDIPVIDLSHVDAAEQEQHAMSLVNEQMRRSFNLEQSPLMRLHIYRLSEYDHIIASSIHHIVNDAWSGGVIMRELVQLYPAFDVGASPTLTPLPIQYADFAYWQRLHLKDQALSSQLDYWRRQLAGVRSLELPTDHPRPPIQTSHGRNVILELDPTVFDGLERLSRQASASFFMTVLAAFQVLLNRYTHQEDITVGVPIANRKWLAIENLVGTFVNTLVMRTDLSGAPTFRDLLERVRQVALDAYAHQDISFAHLVAELRPERDTSHAPFFQVLFNVINVPVLPPTFPDATIAFLPADRQGAQFDLSVTVTNVPDNKNIIVNYNTDLFDQATARRLMNHYQVLLRSIVANPDQPISQLEILDESEKQKILYDWNATRRDYPQAQGVHQLFAAQAARTPDAIAVMGDSLLTGREEQLTYRELARRVNQLAHYLQKQGVGPEVRVGISMHRTIEMLVGVLGVLQAGGAYLPLDPAFPKDRLGFMAQDAQIPVLLTEQSLVADLPAHSAQVVCLDTDWARIAQESTDTPISNVAPHNLAYILYTSGSTGKPKGVQVLHRALTNFIVSMQSEPGLVADDVLLSVTTLSFDIAGLELYLPLITGARVVIATRTTLADGRLLAEKMTSTRATVMQATPATWRMLLDAGWQGHPALKILCGGEALPRELADQLLERCGSLWNMYGPTETTIWSTLQHVEKDKPITVGRPIANTTIYVLDANMQPVPIGVPGNLYIGGDGLARGYLNRPELNAERFVRDPFNADPSARMYMTGDVARYLPNGEIDYLGRSDTQVKVRGFRIELGEIESALTQHPGIHQAVVVAHEFQAGDKRLVAYMVPATDAAPSANDLRAFLKDRLPEYMVPSIFMMVDQFPLTPNGKVDRKALPRPEQTPGTARAFVEPRTQLEKQLAQIWQEVLKTQPIGVQDDFFELGGHSLLGVQLFARIENTFGKRLPLATLFQASTIEHLAQLLPQHNDRIPGSSLVAIQPNGSRPPFYCIHEYDGNVLYYRELSMHLGNDQPFYGLQAQGLDGKTPPLTRFEDIAAHYIEEIRALQPQGPYYLGGSSLGGVIAFEVAQQLVAQGQPVALLALFDTWSPGYLKLLQLPLPQVFSRHAEAMSRLTLGDKIKYFTRRAIARLNWHKWYDKQYERWAWAIKHYGCRIHFKFRRPLPRALLDFHIRETMILAQKNYTPKPYPGRVTFFLAADKPGSYYHAPHLDRESLVQAGFCSTKDVEALWQQVYPSGWGALAAGGLDVIEVPGTHAFLVREPHVQALAEKLRACIDQARQR